MYQNPTADVSAIYNTLLSQPGNVQPQLLTELSAFQKKKEA
jgi:hypothetical protein